MNKHTSINSNFPLGDILVLDIKGFEGPLELLLSLAQNQKVDLREISILELVEQYLAFIGQATTMKIELAAEYLMMATWLAYLKSKLLLPIEEDGEEVTGEEMELYLAFQLKRLAEMKKCSQELFLRPQLGIDFFPRGQSEIRDKVLNRKLDATLLDLLRSYATINNKKAFTPLKLIRSSILNIDDALKSIVKFFFNKGGWFSLEDIIPRNWRDNPEHVKSAMATTFAASLELVKSGDLKIKQPVQFKSMKIKSNDNKDVE
tara:strand:+ start:68 stop:850 length:783 start_codon:yes stop_codon:yes gene_type:complete